MESSAIPRWLAPAAWLLAFGPVLLLTMHATGILVLSWSERPLTGFQHVAGFSYAVPLGTRWMSHQWVADAPILVLENQHPLPCIEVPSGDIPENGAGRVQLEGGWLFVSASDNTDPNQNGRQYAMRWPSPPSRLVVALCLLLSLAGGVVGARLTRGALVGTLTTAPMWLCAAIVLVPMALHRWWFFADVPLPAFQPDSASYYLLAQSLFAGEWPRFEIRPPGYPAFLGAGLALTRTMLGVTVIQTILTALSALALVFSVRRLDRRLALPTAVAMAAFVTGLWPLEHDTTLLSESLYANAILLGQALVIRGVAARTAWPLAAGSTAFGVAILTRPAGLFLIAPFLLCAVYLFLNRPRRQLIAFALPLPLVMVSLSVYNYTAAKAFAVTAWGEANLAVATFTLWDGDPSYPPELNAKVASIRGIIQARLTDEDKSAIQTSWEPERLAPAFLKGFWQPALNQAMALGPDYQESRRLIRQVAFDSVRRQPTEYLKFFWTMSYLFHVGNIVYKADFADFMRYRVQHLFPELAAIPDRETDPVSSEALRLYFRQGVPTATDVGSFCTTAAQPIRFLPTEGRRIHRAVHQSRDLLFGRDGWAYAAGVVWFAALVRFAWSRGRHTGAFVISMVGLQAFAAGLVVALVEYAGQRYSYPTEFAYFCVVALAPLLWLAGAKAGLETATVQ